jgi:hypothetical protein
MLKKMFEHVTKLMPLPAMVRALLENVFSVEQVDACFAAHADKQYTRELLFSKLVELMSVVVFKIRPSVHAAYQGQAESVGVTVQAVYDKLKGIELAVSAELVRASAARLAPIIAQMGGALPPLLPGYAVRIVDGNALAATEHRLKVLRGTAAGPLPGKSLAVLDPSTMLIRDIFLCADGHAQERALLGQVLEHVQPGELYIDDRNFCTGGFLWGIAYRRAYFNTRQHQSNPAWEALTRWKQAGRTEKGEALAERQVRIWDDAGHALILRQIRISLAQPTRDGEEVIYLLTNLPRRIRAAQVAALYLKRWTVETVFQILTTHLRCEINTLGYPAAALFSFCMAVVAYNLLATVRAALRSAHGADTIEEEVSSYYLAEDIAATYRGMMRLLPPQRWQRCQKMTAGALARWLEELARQVPLEQYRRHPRGPKKPQPKLRRKNAGHVATSRLLKSAQRQG